MKLVDFMSMIAVSLHIWVKEKNNSPQQYEAINFLTELIVTFLWKMKSQKYAWLDTQAIRIA